MVYSTQMDESTCTLLNKPVISEQLLILIIAGFFFKNERKFHFNGLPWACSF